MIKIEDEPSQSNLSVCVCVFAMGLYERRIIIIKKRFIMFIVIIFTDLKPLIVFNENTFTSLLKWIRFFRHDESRIKSHTDTESLCLLLQLLWKFCVFVRVDNR